LWRRVQEATETGWFFNDSNPPWANPDTAQMCEDSSSTSAPRPIRPSPARAS